MTVLYIPLSLTAPQAERFLNRELRFREVESVKVSGNLMTIEHFPRTVFEMTAQDIAEYYGINAETTIVY